MGLAEVQRGMACTAASVVRGTDIETFEIEVLDIVSGDAAARQPYILFRASGPVIDRTGIGPGFSGSPIRCPRADGTPAIAGAISEAVGEFGGKTALATPIELVLGEPVDVPVSKVRHDPGLITRARPIAEPLSFAGLSPDVAVAVRAAGRRVRRTVYAAPAAPRDARFPALPLVPGSAMAAGLSSGDLTSSAIGTVTYVDGDRLWAFGHPLDAAGARSLFLQDAYVYTVINNPNGSAELSSYKYAAPGRAVGTITSDGISAIAGRIGALPPSFPLRVVARDEDRDRQFTADVRIADETALGLPTGSSPLLQVGGVAVAQLLYETLGGAPTRQSGELCVRITLAEKGGPLRFCNAYVGGGGGVEGIVGGPLVSDFVAAVSQLDAYRFGPLTVTGVDVRMTLRRSLRQAFLLGASAPRSVRRGRSARVVLRLRRVDGERMTRVVRVEVPRSTPRGMRRLQLVGTAEDVSRSADGALETVLDISDLPGDDGPVDDAGPRNVRALAQAVAAVRRYDGVTASFRGPARAKPTFRDPGLRISGVASAAVRIR